MRAFTSQELPITVTAIADPRMEELKISMRNDERYKDTHFYKSAEEMLNNEALDGIFIGTRCSLHTHYASMVIEKGLPLFLEKPVCISDEQYAELVSHLSEESNNKTVVSFPLRLTCIVEAMHELVNSGKLGTITSVEAINNVPYGSVYYHSWYRDPSETGGLFLQKATHDIDYITYILGKDPVEVFAMTSKMYFKGDMPSGLKCKNCPKRDNCKESDLYVKNIMKEEPTGEYCCFAKDTGNEDVGAALFRCQDGTIINYHQTFLVKQNAGRRGARFIGTKGSAEFDFYTAELRVDMYEFNETAIHKFKWPNPQHFGGDEALARLFMEVINCKPSTSSLKDGLKSAKACLSAKRAANTNSAIQIEYSF